MAMLPLAVYLTPVYADSDGFALSLGFVGLMLALSRVFDGLTDPLIGFLSERRGWPYIDWSERLGDAVEAEGQRIGVAQ